MRMGRRSLAWLALVFAFSAARIARAQAPSGSDKVAAEALFEDARKLVADGKYADACPKFQESERLDPSPSTLLNLASCWERLGRTATAWATYKEAESAANAARRPDYMAAASRHAAALAPTLARVTIAVPQPVEGLQIKRDGVLRGTTEWGVPIPSDTGPHTIEASAPGYVRWTSTLTVPRDGAEVTVTVPPLQPSPPPAVDAHGTPPVPATSMPDGTTAPPAPGAAPPVSEAPPPSNTQRTVGLVVAGAGVVGLGVSGVLALIANGKKQDSLKDCPHDPNVCDATGVSLRNDALSAGDAATVAFVLGAAALAGGGILWFTAPRSDAASTSGSAAPAGRWAVSPTLGGAVLRVAF
jgi:serine/threonine-protein kinase